MVTGVVSLGKGSDLVAFTCVEGGKMRQVGFVVTKRALGNGELGSGGTEAIGAPCGCQEKAGLPQ